LVENIKKIIQTARKEQRTFLLEPESKQIMQELGLSTTAFKVASTVDEAKAAAAAVGFPVVLKVISPQIIHKTDAGGVHLNIANEAEVEMAYNTIMKNSQNYDAEADVRGVLIEKMVEPSVEIIIGVTRDPTFGPAVMFGLGGIFVELLKDVSFRIAPLKKQDAEAMIHEIKALPMLQGFRGGPKVQLEPIINALVTISEFSMDYINDIEEIDLNPIFAYENKLITVDARIILTKE
jgi:acetyl-CoA synthetase (ADP-forming)